MKTLMLFIVSPLRIYQTLALYIQGFVLNSRPSCDDVTYSLACDAVCMVKGRQCTGDKFTVNHLTKTT